MQSKRFTLFSVLALSVFVFSLVSPGIARADEGTPPSPETVATESAPADAAPTDEAPVNAAPTEEAPTDAAPTEAAPLAEPTLAPTEDTTVVENLPAGTDLVVLDASGEALPLATAETLSVIEVGDPMWCPDSQTPANDMADGNQDCTNSFARFTGNKNNALIPALTVDAGLLDPVYEGSGTIYIKKGNINPNDQNRNIVLDGIILTNIQNGNLTVQGGWDFNNNVQSDQHSVFVNSTLSIINWNGNVTVNRLKFELGSGEPLVSGNGLEITTISGDIAVNNVIIDGATEGPGVVGNGLYINDVNNVSITDSIFRDNDDNGTEIKMAGDVTIENSEFRRNAAAGLKVDAVNNITIKDAVAQNNYQQGAKLAADESINVQGGSFNSNGYQGLKANAYNVSISDAEAIANGDRKHVDRSGFRVDGYQITLSNLYAAENSLHGLNIQPLCDGCNDFVTINNSTFENNDSIGANIEGAGTVNITGSTFDNNGKINGQYGANIIDAADVTVTNSEFSNNGVTGLMVAAVNNLTLKDVVAENNLGGPGTIILEVDNVNITGSTFKYNSLFGANIFGAGTVNVADSTFEGNTVFGAFIVWVDTINITGSTFKSNDLDGAVILGADTVNITDSTFDLNGGNGASISAYGPVSIFDSNFNNNGGNGLYFSDSAPITLSLFEGIPSVPEMPTIKLHGVVANGNGLDGFKFGIDGPGVGLFSVETIEPPSGSGSNIIIECSQFNGNDEDGINIYNPDGSNSLVSVVAENNGNENIAIQDSFSMGEMECTVKETPSESPHINRKGWKPGIGNGFKVPFACEDYIGLMLWLPNTDFVKFPCGVGTGASASSIPASNLPALPDRTVISALQFTLYGATGTPQATVGFQLPAGATGAGYSILFWDGANWVDVGGSLSSDGFFEAPVNATGLYVLVH